MITTISRIFQEFPPIKKKKIEAGAYLRLLWDARDRNLKYYFFFKATLKRVKLFTLEIAFGAEVADG